MRGRVIRHAKEILEGIEIGFFDTAKPWNDRNFEKYYQYFNDPDQEVRKYALLVFGAALGNWQMKSAFVFPRNTDPIPKSHVADENKVYRFEDYIQAFFENKEAIESEYPTLYKSILINLVSLDLEVPFEKDFPDMNPEYLAKLRRMIRQSGLNEHSQFHFNQLLREVGLPTFFLNG